MPFPTKIGATTPAGSTGAVTVAWPAGILAGDIALLFVETCNEAITLTTNPDGFVELASSPQGTGTAGTDPATRLTVFWCRATGSSMTSVVTSDSGDHQLCSMQVFRGCVETGNPWDAMAAGVVTPASTAISWGTITTTVDECLIVGAVTNSLDSASANVSGYTNAALASITEINDGGTAAGNGGGIAIFTAQLETAGATGTTMATGATGSVQGWLILSLKPLATTPCFQAAGTPVHSTGSVTPAWPAHSVNDIALLVIESDAEAISLTTANGFALVDSATVGSSGASGENIAVYWCRATSAAMSAPVVTDSGDHTIAYIVTFRNCVTSGNPYNVTANSTASTSTSVSCPAVTTLLANQLVVNFVGNLFDTTGPQSSGWTNANLVSIAEIQDSNTSDGNGGGIGCACGILATAGSSGNTTMTLANTSPQAMVTLALYAASYSIGGFAIAADTTFSPVGQAEYRGAFTIAADSSLVYGSDSADRPGTFAIAADTTFSPVGVMIHVGGFAIAAGSTLAFAGTVANHNGAFTVAATSTLAFGTVPIHAGNFAIGATTTLAFLSHVANELRITQDGDFWAWWPGRDRLRITQADGTITHAQILAAVGNIDGTISLRLSVLLSTSPVTRISWLELVRFEHDDIDVVYEGIKFAMQTTARVVQQ